MKFPEENDLDMASRRMASFPQRSLDLSHLSEVNPVRNLPLHEFGADVPLSSKDTI